MANLRYPVLVRNALANALTTYAGNGALLKIFSGTQPSTGGAETTKLAQLTFSGAIAGAAANGILTLNLPNPQTSAEGNGTASWARITKSDGTTVVMDMDVSATLGGGTLQLDNTSITIGGTVAITSAAITVGNA